MAAPTAAASSKVFSKPLADRPDRCAACAVRDSAVCAALNERELDELSRIGRTRTFQRGETIFAAGEPSYACGTLISGAAKLSAIDGDGVERILALIHPAGFLGQLFTPTNGHEVTALTESTMCLFPREGFERLMASYPALTRSILDRTLAELDASRALTGLIGRRDIKARLSGLILAFARAADTSPCGIATAFELPLSREEIASLIGTTIETVSRRMTELEQGNIIERQGLRGLILRDLPALEHLAA